MAYTTITDPSAHFQTSTYDGNGYDDRNITYDGNSNMQPDFLWFKRRNQDVNHILFDSTRGVTSRIHSNNTNAAAIEANFLQAFNSDGFQVGTDADINGSGGTFVSWGWKATGGTTSSNTDGTITSTVQANTTAGFSIVSFTGDGNTSTIGHGLGVEPKLYIIKNRSSSGNWFTYTKVIDGSLDFLYLNLTNAKDDSGLSSPTTSVFTVNSSVAPNTDNMIAYCFAEKQGYSKFGSYTGNGSTNGTFVYTGFKPAWTMIKNTQTAGYNWIIQDTKRFGGINSGAGDKNLAANSSSAEPSSGSFAGNQIDYLSNGFKLRSTAANTNAAQSYIYMAFAENPLVATNGVPSTAE